MCGIIGGLKISTLIDQPYSNLCSDGTLYKIFKHLFDGSGNRAHDFAGAYTKSQESSLSIYDIGTITDFLKNHGTEFDNYFSSNNIIDFIGHLRYATNSGAAITDKCNDLKNIQPHVIESDNYSLILAENGETCLSNNSIKNESESKEYIQGTINRFSSTNDTSLKGMYLLNLLETISKKNKDTTVHHNLMASLKQLYQSTFDYGMFSTIGELENKDTNESQYFIMRDGGRPLYQFDFNGFRFYCSESAPINTLMQDLEIRKSIINAQQFPAGNIVVYDMQTGNVSQKSTDKIKPSCFFEPAYFMEHATKIPNLSNEYIKVDDIRAQLGLEALFEHQDLLNKLKCGDYRYSYVPNSAKSYTNNFFEVFNIIDSQFIERNKHYNYRTFISSDDPLERYKKANNKFIFDEDKVNGQDIVVIDDSVVRSTVARVISYKLKMLGANSVHFISATPPIVGPCFGGIDTHQKDLAVTMIESQFKISAKKIGADYYGTGAHIEFEQAMPKLEADELITDYLGGTAFADSFSYLSIAGLNKVFKKFNLPTTAQCCITGQYPYKAKGLEDWGFVDSSAYNKIIIPTVTV